MDDSRSTLAPEMVNSTILAADDLRVSYRGVEVLHGVSLRVRESSVLSVLGANGSGKTTLVRGLVNVPVERKGTVYLRGSDVTGLSTTELVRAGVVHVPQERHLFAHMTVDENLKVAYSRSPRQETYDALFHECLDLFPPLADMRSRLAGNLSGGQQQMCAIARALMLSPAVLILDEPSTGLAPVITQKVYDAIRQLAGSGRTLVLCEQNVHQALAISDDVVVLEEGRVKIAGDVGTIRESGLIQSAYLGL